MTLLARVGVAREAFDLDVSFSIDGATTVAVLGPNGAGKSTLLRSIAGLLPLDFGSIAIDGVPVDDVESGTFVPPERRRIGFVFQQYLLFPHLTVVDNVAFGLRSTGASRARARLLANAALDRVGLHGFAKRRPATLSGGEAQRVALARALVTEPRVLLLDEPLAALDVTTRASVRRDLVTQLAAHDGVRVVVTHDPVEAAAMSDDIVIIENGRIVQRGTPAELAAQPRSSYIADLVGVNFLAGTARNGVIDIAGTTVVATGAPDGAVMAVIHPRAVVLHRTRPEGTPRNVWQGRVLAVDPEGERVRVTVDAPIRLVSEITAAAAAEVGAAPGATVWVSVKATEVSVFAR